MPMDTKTEMRLTVLAAAVQEIARALAPAQAAAVAMPSLRESRR